MKIVEDWYTSLVDDIQSTMVESVFASRWALIEGYHLVGARLRMDEDKMPMTELVNHCAVDMGVSSRKLWYAVQFYDTFPKLDQLPEGKNISWTKIKRNYLVKSKERPESEASDDATTPQIMCPACGFQWNAKETKT